MYEKWLSTRENADKQTYQQISREVKREVIKAKNEAWEAKCEQIGHYLGSTKSREAWKVIKNLRSNKQEKNVLQPIDVKKWETYYEDLLTEKRREFKIVASQTKETRQQETFEPITTNEIKQALNKMKDGRAPGPGGINIELIKSGPEQLTTLLAELFNKCLEQGKVPNEWNIAHITNIYKKGNKKECTNYRGISVLDSMGKLYGKVIKERIEKEFEEQEEQSGFRAGRSCVDNLFCIKQVVEKRSARDREVHLVFVDLEKAYDSVPLMKLWEAMEKNQISDILIGAVKALYKDMTAKIKVGQKLSKSINVTKGLRQGCCVSPTLFKIFVKEALGNWRKKCEPMGITIGEGTLYTLQFADDQVILAEDEQDAHYMLRKLKEEYERWGLTINLNKTEYLVIGGKAEDLELGAEKIRAGRSYKYLGVKITSQPDSQEEIRARIGQGRTAIRQLNSVLWSRKITKHVKRRIYKTIIESISTYGSELWVLNETNKQKLRAMEMDCWRRCCGHTRMDRIRNQQIRDEMEVDIDIVETIEVKRLIWYGHVQRMGYERWPKRINEWQPHERRKRGRPRKTWHREVKEAMQSRNIQEEEWQDRQVWRQGCERRRQL